MDPVKVPLPDDLSLPTLPTPLPKESSENPVTVRWRGVIKDAMLDGVILPVDIPQAFPVVTGPQGQRGWQPIDWKAMKELKTAISQYGLTSTYTQQMLSALFSSTMFTPNDCH